MGDDDDRPLLHLNTLARFSKRNAPSTLALEEHGHCEVPAGCGGVVMRWRDPRCGIDALLEMAATRAVSARAMIDGEPMESARCSLSYGEHVLDIALTFDHDEQTHLWIATIVDSADANLGGQPLPQLCSSGDGQWLAGPAPRDATAERLRALEDAQLAPLDVDASAEPAEDARWRVDVLRGRGAAALVLPTGQRALLVRRRFVIAGSAPVAPEGGG